MSAQSKPSVTFAESINIKARRVGEYTQQMYPDLVLADHVGYPCKPGETGEYSFLLGPLDTRAWWQKPFIRRRLRPLIGRLYFRGDHVQATHKKWVLEIYGRNHVERLKALAEDLVGKFEVEIHVRLASEETHWEWSDLR